MLRTLATRGHRLGVCSNSPGRAIDALLSRAGWSGLFDVVIHADNARQLKPSAEPLRQVLTAMGGLPAREAWLIGDSAMDSRCAAAAGSPFVWFSSGYGRPEVGDPMHAQIARPTELLSLLGSRRR